MIHIKCGSIDSTHGRNTEHAQRCQELFIRVVMVALDDAIADDKKYGNGEEQIALWARSRDGQFILSCAGIDPNERTVAGLQAFVRKGVKTAFALSTEALKQKKEAHRRD